MSTASVDLSVTHDDDDDEEYPNHHQKTTLYHPVGTTQRLELETRTRKAKLADLQTQAEERAMAECTFHPRINNNTNLSDPSSSVRLRSLSPSSPWEERLSRPTKLALPEGCGRELEQLEECTFQPRINVLSKAMVASTQHGHHVPSSRRSGGHSVPRSEDAECTFAPKINTNTPSPGPRVSLQNRVYDILKHKEEHVLQKAIQLDAECTFSPTLNQKSKVIATSVLENEAANAYEHSTVSAASAAGRVRQYDDALLKKQSHDIRARILRTQELMQPCTFQPTIDAVSRKIIHQKAELRNEDFDARQRMLLARKSQRMKLAESNTQTPKQRRLDPHLVWEQIQRLHHSDPQRSRAVKQELQRASSVHQCPFRPTLGQKSKEIAAKRGSQGYMEPKRSSSVTTTTPQRENNAENNIVHTPRANAEGAKKRSMSSVDMYNEQQRLKREHDERIEELQRLKAIKELAECTFTPMISEHPQKTTTIGAQQHHRTRSGSAPIKGMQDYMSRVERARALTKDKKEREANIGKGKPCNGPNYTLLKPFHLQTSELPRSARNTSNNNNSFGTCSASSPSGVAYLVKQLVGKK